MTLEKVERLRRALWTWKQPLTRRPADVGASVSDLFVWRNSREWRTSFELIDISALFPGAEDVRERYAIIYFFDLKGQCFLEKRFDLLSSRRQTIELAALIGCDHGEVGTFAVFHSLTPSVVMEMGAFLAERGYVSYRYRDAPIRAYVHGNFDATSRGKDGRRELLGGSGVLPREYRLQCEMTGPALYELALVNSTNAVQQTCFQLLSARNGKILRCQETQLRPGGADLLSFQIDEAESARVIIKSKVVMARPLVFRIQNLKLDVFHG